jgi:hypothetical protein
VRRTLDIVECRGGCAEPVSLLTAIILSIEHSCRCALAFYIFRVLQGRRSSECPTSSAPSMMKSHIREFIADKPYVSPHFNQQTTSCENGPREFSEGEEVGVAKERQLICLGATVSSNKVI